MQRLYNPRCMPFLVGVTPDFVTHAKGRFERELDESLPRAGIRWEIMPEMADNVATPEALGRYDAVFALGTTITEQSLSGVDRLALVARWGVGYDRIDTAALTAHDVALAITPNAVRRPVAEAILTYVLALTTNLTLQDRLVREGKWRGDLPKLGRNIRGRVLGSLGCGNIARELFRMVQSLGFSRLIACDPYTDPEDVAGLGVELVPIETLFRESDYLCVNTLLNSETRGLVNKTLLRLMKPSAYLINTARGPIVDQAALTQALQEGWIAGAGLDVFEHEPLPLDDPIRQAPNTILSPHGLPWTEEVTRDNGLEACANIVTIARGEVPRTIVNKNVIARPGFQAKLTRYGSQR
jgi:phosphoglycerate dehydrogenase-like enzyme